MTHGVLWMMEDGGAIKVRPGQVARALRAESPLFMATARARNASLEIDPNPYLYTDAHYFYRIKATELTPWED